MRANAVAAPPAACHRPRIISGNLCRPALVRAANGAGGRGQGVSCSKGARRRTRAGQASRRVCLAIHAPAPGRGRADGREGERPVRRAGGADAGDFYRNGPTWLRMGDYHAYTASDLVSEFRSEGRIDDSNHVPRGMLEFWLDPESAYFKQGKLDLNKEMVLFCAGGMRSALAAKSLKDMGFKKVSHIDGGFGALKQSKFKIT